MQHAGRWPLIKLKVSQFVLKLPSQTLTRLRARGGSVPAACVLVSLLHSALATTSRQNETKTLRRQSYRSVVLPPTNASPNNGGVSQGWLGLDFFESRVILTTVLRGIHKDDDQCCCCLCSVPGCSLPIKLVARTRASEQLPRNDLPFNAEKAPRSFYSKGINNCGNLRGTMEWVERRVLAPQICSNVTRVDCQCTNAIRT